MRGRVLHRASLDFLLTRFRLEGLGSYPIARCIVLADDQSEKPVKSPDTLETWTFPLKFCIPIPAERGAAA